MDSLEKMTQESTSEAKNERIIQMKYNGSEAWKLGVFQQQHEKGSRMMEGKVGQQGPAQVQVHRPEHRVGFHCKCNWGSTSGFKQKEWSLGYFF